MAMASMPMESGMFASVEDRSLRDLFAMKSSAARRASSNAESCVSSPPGRLPMRLIFHSSFRPECGRGRYPFRP